MSQVWNFWEKYYVTSLSIAFLLGLFYLLSIQSSFLYGSVLQYQNIQQDPFDGTLYPIEFVPDPFLTSYEERKWKFVDIDITKFIKIPKYDPNIFIKDPEQFSPMSDEYKQVLTQRIIYTVPYLWTYELDYREYAGSHPGIDIIAPRGTPVKNIANGVVVWVWNQASGFWKYILVRHNNLTLENGEKKDIYVLYAHLDSIWVSEWVKVAKWDVIGNVWDTGTATTPHLHFQIDVETAPFHPFWPFTSAQMREAWVSFFGWVTTWLWKQEALLHTIHPLRFVHNYMSQNPITQVKPWTDVTFLGNNLLDLIESNMLVEESVEPIIEEHSQWSSIIDLEEEIVSEPETEETTLSQTEILQEQIIRNEVLLLTTESQLNLVDSIAIQQLTLPENTQMDRENSLQSDVLDTEDKIWDIEKPLPVTWFYDIAEDYEFLPQLKYFHDKNIIQWFHDSTFRPYNQLTRIEAFKIMFLSFDKTPIEGQSSKFDDIQTQSWENTYVNVWLELWIFSAENSKFYPFREITKAEALKTILLLSWINLDNYETIYEIADINQTDWVYKYVAYALDNNLIELQENHFYPTQALNREEFIVLLYKLLQNS